MEERKIIRPLSEIPGQFCSTLEFLFTDIDDTITLDGMMPAETLESVYRLTDAGIKVVLVTGRPAGWCDYFARMWPVAGIVGENGAFYFSYDRKNKRMKRVYLISESERKANRQRLDYLGEKILTSVPGCRISADQPFRIADLAIDISEDVEPLEDPEVEQICRIIEEEKAEYKISSIHINCWYGKYDKLTCFNRFISDFTGAGINDYQEKLIYAGDSPNDEPMFSALKHTVAVANIKKYLDSLKSLPSYIAEREGADGFADLTEIILQKRSVNE